MTKIQYSIVSIVWLAGAGCQSAPPPDVLDDDQAGSSSMPAQVVGSPQAREALRARLDLDHSRIRLEVSKSTMTPQLPLASGALSDTMARHQEEGAPAAEWNLNGLNFVTLGTQTATFDPQMRRIDVHDSRGYATDVHADPPAETLEAVARDVLTSLGISNAEAKADVVALGAAEQDEAGEVKVARMGQKVFFFRNIDGVPVAGSRMAFSFARDGSLRHIRGSWPTLDIARSHMRSRLSQDDVVEKALDAMIEGEASLTSTNPIIIETFLQVDDVDGMPVARLRGAALTQANGPEGTPGRGVRYEFDI